MHRWKCHGLQGSHVVVVGLLTSTLLPLFGSWRKKHPDGSCAIGEFLQKLRKKITKTHARSSKDPVQVPMVSCTRKIVAGTAVPLDKPSENYRRPVLNTEEAAEVPHSTVPGYSSLHALTAPGTYSRVNVICLYNTANILGVFRPITSKRQRVATMIGN